MTEKQTRFVEMDWREALRKYADGYDVLRMDVEPRPGKVAPDYITDSLDDVLQGYHYMVDQMSGPEERRIAGRERGSRIGRRPVECPEAQGKEAVHKRRG